MKILTMNARKNDRHYGVRCDSCGKKNFPIRRYKCLKCYNTDLCGDCFEAKKVFRNHKSSHAMQCLIPKGLYGLFYAGEPVTDLAFSYTCPMCGKVGHNINTLCKHIHENHANSKLTVICPICVSLPDKSDNFKTKELMHHINTKHSEYLDLDQEGSTSSSSRLYKPSSKGLIEPLSQAQMASLDNATIAFNQQKATKTGTHDATKTVAHDATKTVAHDATVYTSQDPIYSYDHVCTGFTPEEQVTSLSRNQSIFDSITDEENDPDTDALLNDDSDSEVLSLEDVVDDNTFSLNQVSLNSTDMENSDRYIEDEEIATWPQDVTSDSIYNQPNSLTLEADEAGQHSGTWLSSKNGNSTM